MGTKRARARRATTSSLPPGIERARSGRGYRARIQVGGQRVRSEIVATVDQAVRLRDRMQSVRPGLRPFSVGDAIQLQRTSLATSDATDGTLHYWESRWREIRKAWPEETSLVTITPRAVEEWVRMRIEDDGVAPSTARKSVDALSRLFRLASRRSEETGIESNPCLKIDRPKVRAKRFPFFTAAEMSSLIERIRFWKKPGKIGGPIRRQERDALIVALLYLSGIRRTEAARLKVDDCDVFRGRLHVTGKTGSRTLPIEGDLRVVLEQLIAQAWPDGRLFTGPNEITKRFTGWQERLGEPRLTPHALRHSFATAQVAAGTSITTLQHLMGHTTPLMTARYYRTGDAAARAAMGTLSLRMGGAEESDAATG